MAKKILYVATSDVHIALFHLPYLKWMKEQGFEVHLAVEKRGNVAFDNIDRIFYLPFPRTPFRLVYFSTYKKLKRIIEKEKYSLVHCHTPLPGAVARLAARNARKNGTKVLYTAHGFHFYKGAPLMNWLTYFPAEWILSGITDGIVTMNNEDFGFANNRMHNKNAYIIPGMGVNPAIFIPLTDEKKTELREKMGYKKNQIILIYVAEFNPGKNHHLILSAINEIKDKVPDLKVLFAGKGPFMEKSKAFVKKHGLENTIEFLGFRDDIPILSGISDIGISASRREGLPISIVQEIFCGLPIVATDERGHIELIIDGENGYLFPQNNTTDLVMALMKLINNPDLRKQMGQKSLERSKLFSIEKSVKTMATIYKTYLPEYIEN